MVPHRRYLQCSSPTSVCFEQVFVSIQLTTNGKNTVKIIELATWRTGSSFLGELISLHEETFYSYEPLHLLSDNVR